MYYIIRQHQPDIEDAVNTIVAASRQQPAMPAGSLHYAQETPPPSPPRTPPTAPGGGGTHDSTEGGEEGEYD